MPQLEFQQRGLRDLIKGRMPPVPDSYLASVSRSAGLQMVQEIALWWRELQLGVQCHFTARLLRQTGSFHAMVRNYFNGNSTSPFVEELSHDFLSFLSSHPDPLIRAVAQFESALLEVRAGSANAFEVLWDRNPDKVFLALETGAKIPAAEAGSVYETRIARTLPALVECHRFKRPG